ncbi:hypothetical protein [Pseudomonas sp. CCC3.1]|uniref:hypothetical protein n=1 Tax=Pseudomonas sp. CCC3.1 TaxID=3048607 RepID=UPI002AC8E112|nr:hypothetical protein [Pseudomonas sp. CCC3.1]MEB0208605.1 hypothetical protein [Pseudomonas sp. CCC3.1]WPX37063.1 hypothetical protein RHM56_02380 [Pseudomonas sp. CCC3.1]
MAKVNKVEAAPQRIYKQGERWHDGLGGEHFTEADAVRAIENHVASNEREGINTLTKADGIAMLVYVLFIVFLGYGAVWSLNHGLVFRALGFAAGAVAAVYIFYKFFMGTLPSFRFKTYIALVFLVIASHFILLKFFNIQLL